MIKRYKLSLFIFHRDLRIDDNSSLMAALESSKQVIPCFILDDRQIKNNPYYSDNAVQFMTGCLRDLDKQLKRHGGILYIYSGKSENILLNLIRKNKIDAVYCNRDYTPFSRIRDNKLKNICMQHGVSFLRLNDYLLIEPENIKTTKGKP